MKNKKKLLLVLTLAFCFAFAMFLPDVDFYFTQVNYAQAAGLDAYYSSVTATSGKELSGQLHDLIVSTHTTYSSYNDCRYKAPNTDPGKGSNTVLEFYTHTDIGTENMFGRNPTLTVCGARAEGAAICIMCVPPKKI